MLLFYEVFSQLNKKSNSLILGIGMSVLSFPDVVVFCFILIKGTFIELKYMFIAILMYLGSTKTNNNSNKQCKDLADDDEHDQTHKEKEDIKTNEKILEIYVCEI